LNETKCDKNEILGVKKKCTYQYPIITKDSSFMEYIYVSFQKLLDGIDDHKEIETIPYNISCDMDIFNNYEEWFYVFTISEKRKKLIDSGVDIAIEIYPSFVETCVDVCEKEEPESIIGLLEKGEKGEKGEK
jgi:hypothetical protein